MTHSNILTMKCRITTSTIRSIVAFMRYIAYRISTALTHYCALQNSIKMGSYSLFFENFHQVIVIVRRCIVRTELFLS